MLFLQGHGISSTLALKIYRAFGTETVAKVKDNPYCLAREVHGIGFILADRIARNMGISDDSPLRVQAGILHVLNKFSDGGHCFAPLALLKDNASQLLGVDGDATEKAIQKLAGKGDIIIEERADRAEKVYGRDLYQAECRVTSALRNLLASSSSLRDKGLKGIRDKGLDPSTLQFFIPSTFLLDEEQREAVVQALQKKVLVITGGPGTGKTTLLTSLLALLRESDISFALAAPTGRAAKRMAEMSGEEARTIHRLLEYDPRDHRFQRKENNPLKVDVVIIDEASMVDLFLMDHLLRAVDPRSHFILLGDVDQLPSVGPGSVLRDLIESGVVPVVVLRRIFRQARESLIVTNAHRILHGQPPLYGDGKTRSDFVFIARQSEEEILEAIKGLVKSLRVQGFQELRDFLRFNPSTLRPFNEVQVLSPMHRGLLGTMHLNRELRNLLNPEGESVERGGSLFRLGDRVMQLRNNYDKGVFNGDMGKIVTIDNAEGELCVDFYGRPVSYAFEELEELSLAYATSIHKSQGSEYPVVIIPLHTSHYPMLYRSILYTAVTRGKELVVLVGSQKALWMAIRNVRVEQRFTGLKERLMEI